MNPQPLFCANFACASRGETAKGNLGPHEGLKERCKCRTCGQPFTTTKGTLYYRLKTDPKIVTLVLALLAYGCPPQAIGFAFGLDERTVASWRKKAGEHCPRAHEPLVEPPQDLPQGQADEIYVKAQGRCVFWMALALCVPTRLWLGGVVGPQRDKNFLPALARPVKACAALRPLLLVPDGWRGYGKAWPQAFRSPLHPGQRGRPFLLPWPHVALGHIVKGDEAGRVSGMRVCRLWGAGAPVALLLPFGQVLNTAYSERFNATFRTRRGCLCRRTRSLARRGGEFCVSGGANPVAVFAAAPAVWRGGRRRWQRECT